MIKILEKDFNSFFEAPFVAYGDDSPFVSQMKGDIKRFVSTKNPLFPTENDFSYFSAFRDGLVRGRILVHHHAASNLKYGNKEAFFGYFDVADDFESAKALIDAATAWAKRHGFTSLKGNFNLTAMQQMGVMVDGFENTPYIDFIWNAPHVPEFLDRMGFTRDFYVNTFEVDVNRVDLDRLLTDKARSILGGRSYKFVELDRKKMPVLLEDIRSVLNNGFAENPMFVPLTKEEMAFQAKDLSLIMDERITALVRQNDLPVGTIVCIPDLNPLLKATKSRLTWRTPWEYWKATKNRKRALLIFASVNRDQHSHGLSSAMLVHIIQALRSAGYTSLGVTWVWDENKPVHTLMERMSAEKLHRLCLFKKSISEASL